VLLRPPGQTGVVKSVLAKRLRFPRWGMRSAPMRGAAGPA